MLKNLKGKFKFNIGLKSIILIGVSVALVLVDLLTKIFEERDGWNFTVIPKFIIVDSGSRNPGCAFSFLADSSWGQSFLIAMTFIMLAVLIALFIFLPERFTLLKVAIALVAAGAIGNLIDRIAYREVRDFVEIKMFGNMTSCNFADFWIVFGTIIAVIDILFINEWSLLPLTKSAREAQEKRKNEKEAAKAEKQEKPDENPDGKDNG
ncbi:MAG: signal peptidase II [Clostridia bacterium]|nr:signal peptidase II [Clostridia bacterium]